MQQFIHEIVNFVMNIFTTIGNRINNYNVVLYQVYDQFLQKDVFKDTSLIGLNLTWSELVRFVMIWILVILFIVLFVKFIIKLVSIFRV